MVSPWAGVERGEVLKGALGNGFSNCSLLGVVSDI